jgi:hypothetical protein
MKPSLCRCSEVSAVTEPQCHRVYEASSSRGSRSELTIWTLFRLNPRVEENDSGT